MTQGSVNPVDEAGYIETRGSTTAPAYGFSDVLNDMSAAAYYSAPMVNALNSKPVVAAAVNSAGYNSMITPSGVPMAGNGPVIGRVTNDVPGGGGDIVTTGSNMIQEMQQNGLAMIMVQTQAQAVSTQLGAQTNLLEAEQRLEDRMTQNLA